MNGARTSSISSWNARGNSSGMPTPMRRVLIANRGEIAVRVVRACREMGIETVQVYSDADKDSLAVQLADRRCASAVRARRRAISTRSWWSARRCPQSRRHPSRLRFSLGECGVRAALRAADLTWIGPKPEVIRLMGNKAAAQAAAAAADVRTTPGSQGSCRTGRTRRRPPQPSATRSSSRRRRAAAVAECGSFRRRTRFRPRFRKPRAKRAPHSATVRFTSRNF